jgi:hypothetical protein
VGPAQQRPDRRPGTRGQGRHLPALAHHGRPGAACRGPVPARDGARGLRIAARRPARPRRALDPPADREERAAASLVGAARHEENLRAGLDAALVEPLAAAIREIGDRAAARGQEIGESRLALLNSVIEAFWWQRYTAAGDGAMSPERVEQMVDEVLLPVAEPERETASV